jgi:GT2 family glycosyltransferase
MAELASHSNTRQVEVLIASYNTQELLRDCLTSLFAHQPEGTDLTMTVAVFDNGSGDGSADMVVAHFPAVRLIRSASNIGFARANNALVSSSTADYVMLLNSDTIWRMDVVTPLLSVLESDARIAIVGPMLLSPDGSVQPSSQRFPTLRFEVALLFGRKLSKVLPLFGRLLRIDQALGSMAQPAASMGLLHDAELLWATCWLSRRDDLPRDGPFSESFVTYDEDLDYCRRLHESGKRLVWVPDAKVVHIGSQSSGLVFREKLQARGRRRYYRIHHGLAAGITYGALSSVAIRTRTILRARRS